MKKAFTLAEILITLSIIGVIASMTIPSLVQDVQDAQFKTAWKKTFSDLNGAVRMAMIPNAGSMKGLAASDGQNQFRDILLKYINYTRKCDMSAIGPCWTGVTPIGHDNISDNAGFIMANGSLVIVDYDKSDCSFIGSVCALIDVDVNGFKGPNKVGKDIFGAYMMKNQVVPMGSSLDGFTTCDSSGGIGCSSVYLYK